jgi:hypothetical protein
MGMSPLYDRVITYRFQDDSTSGVQELTWLAASSPCSTKKKKEQKDDSTMMSFILFLWSDIPTLEASAFLGSVNLRPRWTNLIFRFPWRLYICQPGLNFERWLSYSIYLSHSVR